MKKIMGLMLGLSLAIGAFSVAFAQGDSGKSTMTKKKKGKKKKDTEKKS